MGVNHHYLTSDRRREDQSYQSDVGAQKKNTTNRNDRTDLAQASKKTTTSPVRPRSVRQGLHAVFRNVAKGIGIRSSHLLPFSFQGC